MKSRPVEFSESAQFDLLELETWLESAAGKDVARRYVDRIVDQCLTLDLASERGTRRDDILPGLHTIGFRRRVTIAFQVTEHKVTILRIFRGGRDWEADFAED